MKYTFYLVSLPFLLILSLFLSVTFAYAAGPVYLSQTTNTLYSTWTLPSSGASWNVAVGCNATNPATTGDWFDIESNQTDAGEGIGGNVTQIAGWSPLSSSIADGSTINVKLICSSSEMSLYINNTLVRTASGLTATGTNFFYAGHDSVTNAYFDPISASLNDVTPTPTPSSATIAVSPSSSTVTVGTPFNVTVAVNSSAGAFNAAGATVAVSSNLTVTALHNATSNTCNFQYTQTPTTSDPSFAGAIYGSSSSNCNVYTLTLTPNAAGTGTITFTNGKIKAYADSSEILTGVTSGSFTINNPGATPTPTSALSQVVVTSPLQTYNTSYTLSGTKDSAITSVFVNGSSTGVTYPTSTTWQATETLSLGNNVFTLYGSDGSNQTATQNVTVSRHTLGDINGDGNIDLTDASLFAVDYGKTSDLTYILSDMNSDGTADLTDLSILAKLETQ